jgi:hypothetical protein
MWLSCASAGGDAEGDRTHPQRIQAVLAIRADGQEHGFVLAFQPAFARQVPADAMREGVGELRQLRRAGRTGAAQARLALRELDVRAVYAVEPKHVERSIAINASRRQWMASNV